MDKIEVKAFGKVNIGLDVTSRLPNGYHQIKSVMQTVELFDVVTIEITRLIDKLTSAEGISEITLTCSNPAVPQDERNLAFKAARLIMDEYEIRESIRIHIQKNIPMEAGMAGGSADGAAVIKAMNQLFSLSMTEEKMDSIAVKLGADVPFCLRKGTYLSEGIGEKLTKLPDFPHCYMVIVKPDIGISTAWAYKEVDKMMGWTPYGVDNPDREKNRFQKTECADIHPDMDGVIEGIEENNIEKITACMGNIFENVAADRYLQINEIKNTLRECGALGALMSGSGPTVFGIFDDIEKSGRAIKRLSGGNYGKFEVEL